MNFLAHKELIEEGDTAILYINPQKMCAVEVKPVKKNKNNEEYENVFQTMYGALKIRSLIGKKYGSKVNLTNGWIYVLYPTSEFWTVTLPHRTQIIYTPDISMILFQLELKPGSIVVEAGTGSGSLTHALVRTVYPDGHVYSFDFHETRVSLAKEEFLNHGISDLVSVCARDVCTNGYGKEMEFIADAVFLDLPLPWKAILHAIICIKRTGGRFASFSPCIEQVQKTCSLLRDNGFTEINTIECLQKEYIVVQRTLPILSLSSEQTPNEELKFLSCVPPPSMPGHTGYLTFATLPPLNYRFIKSTEIIDETSEMTIETIDITPHVI